MPKYYTKLDKFLRGTATAVGPSLGRLLATPQHNGHEGVNLHISEFSAATLRRGKHQSYAPRDWYDPWRLHNKPLPKINLVNRSVRVSPNYDWAAEIEAHLLTRGPSLREAPRFLTLFLLLEEGNVGGDVLRAIWLISFPILGP